jgi:hypothetical protein
MEWRLEELLRPRYPVILDYPINPIPRYGYGTPPHPTIQRIFENRHAEFRSTLESAVAYAPELAGTPTGESYDVAMLPVWRNRYFSGLDGVVLYGLVRKLRPNIFLEIGSGNSTRFAFKAKVDGKMSTRIVSIDPSPRADIDGICDVVVRQPLEATDLADVVNLNPGDILFIDSSHYVFMNSDVTVCFLDVLPRLRRGVWVHIHDIFLPYDYPKSWAKRHYSEQYLLACLLASNEERYFVQVANAFASATPELAFVLDKLLAFDSIRPGIEVMEEVTEGFAGVSVWIEIR